MLIEIPARSLILLVGPAGAGKSTFARRHFLPTEVVSSDTCRALVADDERNQAATTDAFEVLHLLVRKRLERGRLTVVDATNVKRRDRAPLVALALAHGCVPAAIVFRLPVAVCQARNERRSDRPLAPDGAARQEAYLHRDLENGKFEGEGLAAVWTFTSEVEVDEAAVRRLPPSCSQTGTPAGGP